MEKLTLQTVSVTCECFETQCRRTLRTLIVAAVVIIDSRLALALGIFKSAPTASRKHRKIVQKH